ncbi:MAG: twin-arginine translocation signal domain-containing protein, partial [Planctomycetota bacterium]
MDNQTRREFLKTIGFAAASTGTLSILPSCAGIGQITG